MRTSIAELDQLIGKDIAVLDKGFVRLIDYMGSDASIVQAARVSYGHGTKSVNEDAGLIKYLMRHYHTTPFEMCEIKFHVKVPIFVARQWLRHRTANVNEMSGRYSIIKDEFYIPNKENVCSQSINNKQGRGDVLSDDSVVDVLELIEGDSQHMFSHYDDLLNKYNVARELSRVILPQNTYTEFYWKIDLHNLLHFLRLRIDNHAQFEIREYASAIGDIVAKWVPMTYSAFENYKLYGGTLSKLEIEMLVPLLDKDLVMEFIQKTSAKRGEMMEFTEKLKKWISKS